MTPPRCSAHPPFLSPPERNDLRHCRVLRLGRCAHCIVLCQLCDARRNCIRQLRTPPASACPAGSATIGAMPCRLLHRALRALGMPCPGALRVPPLELRSVLRARRCRRRVLRCTRRPACREARPLCFVRHCARASAARLAHHVSCGPCGTGADAFACGLHSAPWCANNICTVQLLLLATTRLWHSSRASYRSMMHPLAASHASTAGVCIWTKGLERRFSDARPAHPLRQRRQLVVVEVQCRQAHHPDHLFRQ